MFLLLDIIIFNVRGVSYVLNFRESILMLFMQPKKW